MAFSNPSSDGDKFTTGAVDAVGAGDAGGLS